MRAEWLKLKRNPLALALLGLVVALQHSSAIAVELEGSLGELWSVPMHLIPVLFLPYLLTLDRQLETEKWLLTTPTRPWERLAAQLGVCVVLMLGFGAAGMLLLTGGSNPAEFAAELAVALSTALTFTALSLALGSFAAVLVAAVVWSTAADFVLLLLPQLWRGPAAATLPALGLTDFAGGEYAALRLLAHALLLAVVAALARQRSPRW